MSPMVYDKNHSPVSRHESSVPTRLPLKALIFDLGDVLFTWSASNTRIPALTLRSILNTDTWSAFECGRINQEECYAQAAQHVSFSAEDICEALRHVRSSLQPNTEVIRAIRDLKRLSNGQLGVYAMSNISKEDYAHVAAVVDDWQIFDRVFTSGYANTRKPCASFYRHVIGELSVNPRQVIFIDDKIENVLAAQNLGIRAFVFSESKIVVDILSQVSSDPCEKGYRYLMENRDSFHSFTETGVDVEDNFAKILIQEAAPFLDIVRPQWDLKTTWNFFCGTPKLVQEAIFPDDLDTTALALMVVPPEELSTVHVILDNMLSFVHQDGRFQTYYDREKPRVDEIVSANILACFYSYNRGHQAPNTLPMLYDFLLNRSYERGTRYYPDADHCLYFISRLLQHINNAVSPTISGLSKPSLHPSTSPADIDEKAPLPARLAHLLISRMQERVGLPAAGSVELAMRIIACTHWGIHCREDVAALKALQEEDGGWPGGWLCAYGSTGLRLGNRGVATSLAVRAIDEAI